MFTFEGFAMFQMIYTSRETQGFAPSDLKKLLMNARRRNNEVSVTGILIYDAGMFLQALEGDETPVRATFARIEKDDRHTDVNVLRHAMSLGKRRKFGEWSMGFADSTGAAQILRGFIEVGRNLSLSNLDETHAMQILDACSQLPLEQSA
jgi:hypothetical protein